MDGRCETWQRLAEDGHDRAVQFGRLSAWERANLDRLAELERGWTSGVAGETLLHFDLRHDNCLVGEAGRLWFVDWGRACLGPPWIDLVCLLLLSNLGGRDPESLFARHELGATADAEAVDGFLVALASYWTRAAALPPAPGAAHLRSRQGHSRETTIRWLMHRWSDSPR
jgi:aminoglycoside phosphotransferase (APT) family kinase protein